MSESARPWPEMRYVVVDVEGNGQQPPDLVELAVLPIAGGRIGEPTAWLVRPQTPITPMTRRIHGIRNEDLADAPSFEAVRGAVLAHLGDAVVVGHNVRVDLGVLCRKLPGWVPPVAIDTLRLARRLLPTMGSYRLGALVAALDLAEDLPAGLQPHRAAYDVLVTARLFTRLATAPDGAPRTFEELREAGALPATAPEPEPRLFE